MRTWLVTGGAGFIGSNFVLAQRAQSVARIVNLDKLTYAGNLANLAAAADDPDHVFVQGDIADRALVQNLLHEHRPDAIVHFAAESHVDRSIHAPETFIETNVVGTFRLLEEARHYWEELSGLAREAFRFLHVSTDEVYGSLGPDDPAFAETNRYEPNSPYSASKAAGDHLVRAYHETYGLPTLVTNCSNNYGPYQFPEKLIPLMILNAIEGKPLPIYGDGTNVRDWLYVEDHCAAIRLVLERGRVGETYNIGGGCERANLALVQTLCSLVDGICPTSPHAPHSSLIAFVKDRPGHDRRYAMDYTKIQHELGWEPGETLETGLRKTVEWYLSHRDWIAAIRDRDYDAWLEKNYAERGAKT